MPPSQACCGHDHDCSEADCASGYSLFKHIDMTHVSCLNEEAAGSCRNVFRPWIERTQRPEQPLCSADDDPELLLHIPFDGAVKLMAICVIGGPEGRAPTQMRAFVNRDDLDFAGVHSMAPTQEWDLQADNHQGFLEYPTRVTKFNGVHSLDLHFPACFAGSHSEIQFIGLKGEHTQRQRRAVEAVYEARAMPEDHKVPGVGQGSDWRVS